MATRGFSVYTFKLKMNGRKELPQADEDSRLRLCQSLRDVGKITRVGKPPREGASLEKTSDDPLHSPGAQNNTLAVRGASYSPGLDLIHADVALGERGLHDYAVKPDEEDDRIFVSDRAAETPRRVDFFFARSGFEGFLVAELVGRKDPVRHLVRWLNYASRERAKITDPAAQEDSSDEAGLPPVTYYTTVSVQRVSDPKFLESLLSDIRRMDAKFTETDRSNREVSRRLEVRVKGRTEMGNILNRLKQWTEIEEPRLIRETLEDLDIHPEGLDEANMDLNQMKVTVEGRDGRKKTLVPNKLSDLFTYPFESVVRPKNAEYYETITRKLDELKNPAAIPYAGYDDTTYLVGWVDREEAKWGKTVQANPL